MSENSQPKFKGFIVGQGRSGTTLLSALLNRHSQLCVTPETHFYQYLALYPGGIDTFVQQYPNSLRTLFKQMDATDGWTPDPEPIIKQHPKITHSRQIHLLFLSMGNSIANQLNKAFWLEKSPAHIREIALIDSLHPNQPILHLVRDGRSVAESLTRMNWSSDNFLENCLQWLWTMQYYYRFLKKRNNVLTIRYEDLVIAPEPTLKEVCQFLGLEFETTMLEQNENDNYLIETGHQHKNKIKGAIDPSNIDLWRQKVSQTDQRLADRLLGHELKKWHYDTNDNDYATENRMLVSPFVPDGETHPVLDQCIRKIMSENTNLWLDEALNLGEKITAPPRYWLHFDELLSQRFCRSGKYDSYLYFLTALINLLAIKLKGTKFIFYYRPDDYNNCHWKLKKLLVNLALKQASKILVKENNYSDIEDHYFKISEKQKYHD